MAYGLPWQGSKNSVARWVVDVLPAAPVLDDWGVEYRLPTNGCMFIRALDAQRGKGKGIFGGGYLLSQSEAAKAAKAETVMTWELSERERWVSERLQ